MPLAPLAARIRTSRLRAVRFPTWQSFGGNATLMRRALNAWPPFAFSGIVVESISTDFRRARVSLRHRPLTRNYVGTLFGGSLFAMTDPFWMVMVLRNLGSDYVVWDRAGQIEFLAPGRQRVAAEFEVTEELLEGLRAETGGGDKVLRWLETDVVSADGTVVARVRKQLYVRRRREVGTVGQMSDVTVEHNPTESRYEARVGGAVAGFVAYRTSGSTVDLHHTEVDDAYEGKGVGSSLVRGTLDQLREDHLTVVATCPFVKTWFERHEDYQDLIDPR